MSPVKDAGRVRGGPARTAALSSAVFTVAADRLADRAEQVERFTQTARSWQGWCTWEVLDGCLATGWTAAPGSAYAEVGVAGSRDLADLLVFDPATGRSVLVELAVIHDWTTNRWIADLNCATERLQRAASVGVVGLQLIVAVSLASPVDVNATWRGWLEMSEIWKRRTDLKRAMPLGAVGQMLIHGWEIKSASG